MISLGSFHEAVQVATEREDDEASRSRACLNLSAQRPQAGTGWAELPSPPGAGVTCPEPEEARFSSEGAHGEWVWRAEAWPPFLDVFPALGSLGQPHL